MAFHSLLIGTTISTGFCMVLLQRVKYTQYQKVRDNLIKDNADPNVIKIFDEWLRAGFLHQLVKDPQIYINKTKN